MVAAVSYFFRSAGRDMVVGLLNIHAISASMLNRNPPDCGVSADYPVG